jgi:hypothetical protein
MAIDLKYGEVDIVDVPKDEPVFILRAKDILSVPAIARYQTLATEAECGEGFFRGLNEVIASFAEWQTNNAELVKKPD